MTSYRIEFPGYFASQAGEIEAKGYCADVTVESPAGIFRPIFYDPTRLAQEIRDELERSPAYAEQNLVVVPRVTRAFIERAIAKLSETSFQDLTPNREDLGKPQ